MERLTERQGGAVGYIGRHSRRVPGLAEPAETMRVAATREVLQRLADYEDTGMEPSQIKSKRKRTGPVIIKPAECCPYCDPKMRDKERHLYAIKTQAGQWVALDGEDMTYCCACGRKLQEV